MRTNVTKLLELLDDTSSSKEEIQYHTDRLFDIDYDDELMTKLCLHKNTQLRIKNDCLCHTFWNYDSDSMQILHAFLTSETELTPFEFQTVWMTTGSAPLPVTKWIKAVIVCMVNHPKVITIAFLEFLLGINLIPKLQVVPDVLIAEFYSSMFCHPLVDNTMCSGLLDVLKTQHQDIGWAPLLKKPINEELSIKLYDITGKFIFLPEDASELFCF